MSKETGGPAFPVPGFPDEEYFNGMTLRDYFAAKALSGVAAHIKGPIEKPGETGAQAHARWSYQVADAMLAERAK